MQILVVFLLLVACQQSASFEVHGKEISGLSSNLRSDQFFHEVGDWFGHLKDRIYNKLFGQTTTTPSPVQYELPTEVLDLDKFQLQRRLKNREWRQLDLSTLSFDPDQDWGFRVGNWYFIRKGRPDRNGSGRSNSDESVQPETTTIRSTSTIKAETEPISFDTDTTKSSSTTTTTEYATQSVTQLATQQTDAQAVESSTRIDSSEYVFTQTEKRMEDNETDGGSNASARSTEVLMG